MNSNELHSLEPIAELLTALDDLLPLAGWSNCTKEELQREAAHGNGAAPIILRARAALRAIRRALAAPLVAPVEPQWEPVFVGTNTDKCGCIHALYRLQLTDCGGEYEGAPPKLYAAPSTPAVNAGGQDIEALRTDFEAAAFGKVSLKRDEGGHYYADEKANAMFRGFCMARKSQPAPGRWAREWWGFLVQLKDTHGGMVNGNKLSAQAAKLLVMHPDHPSPPSVQADTPTATNAGDGYTPDLDQFKRVADKLYPSQPSDAQAPAPSLLLSVALSEKDMRALHEYTSALIAWARMQPLDTQAGTAFQIDMEDDQVAMLRDYLAAERPVTLTVIDGYAGFGLYAFDTEYPDEGGAFIAAISKGQDRKGGAA